MLGAATRSAVEHGVYSAADLGRYFSETVGFSEETAMTLLTESLQAGLPVNYIDDKPWFHLGQTENWLLRNTRLYQHVLENASFARTNKTAKRLGISARPTIIRCEGTYAFELEARAAIPLDSLLINLSLPFEHACQRNVEIGAFDPPALREYLNPSNELISEIPARLCAENGGILRYRFICDVEEQTEATWAKSKPAPSHLKFPYPTAFRENVERLLAGALAGTQPESDEVVARVVFSFILDHFAYAKTILPDYSILVTGTGTCVHLTRLFASALRLYGIPVREQCGALMSRAIKPSRVQTVHREYSPFAHTWAEVYLDGRGWFPVDFLALQHGSWAATTYNVDDLLKEEMRRDTPRVMDYYFGNLDPYRIFTAPFANRIPPLLMAAPDSANDAHKYAHLTRHVLECDVLPCSF